MAYRYTNRQGQYLAFIHLYTRLNRCPPAEADIQAYFRVSAPAVHQMIVSLEKNGLISRVPRQARSIRVLVPPDLLPALGESAPSPGQADTFEARYPNIADWIAQGGWIELGYEPYMGTSARALDEGGMIWSGGHRYGDIDEWLQSLEDGIKEFMNG